jgi:septum formation protein
VTEATTGRPLILASASPARLATLRAAGLQPQVQVSAVDEEALLLRTGITDPEQVVLRLARAKAEDVAAGLGAEAIVLGCDSVLDLDGVALGKPLTAPEAVRRWQRMRGRSGRLLTGHWLIDLRTPQVAEGAFSAGAPDGASTIAPAVGAVSITTVHFADLSDDEIEAYVATGEPLQVAGAFTIDGLGGPFVTGIEGDHHGVVGVSLPLLRELLGSLDVSWPTLWGQRQASSRDWAQ